MAQRKNDIVDCDLFIGFVGNRRNIKYHQVYSSNPSVVLYYYNKQQNKHKGKVRCNVISAGCKLLKVHTDAARY